MAMVTDIPKKDKWTYSDYAQLPPELRCEIINGKLVMEPAPLYGHQKVSRNLEFELIAYIRGKVKGIVLNAPMDVVLDNTHVFQPDLLFISEKNKHLVANQKAVQGAPDMVVEVLSPGTLVYDRVKKKAFYEKFGVEEYWIVDPQNQSIEVYTLEQGLYELYSSAELKGPAKSKVIEGFTVEAEEIFKEDF